MKSKYVILGAGITGLFLSTLLKGEDYILLEKEDRPGGYCKSFYKDGFTWDYAGHFFHFANPENEKYFNNAFEKEKTCVKEKNTKILYKSRYINYPFQNNIHQLPKSEFLECLSDMYFKTSCKGATGFKKMLFEKFGNGISNRFLIPYNEKLYACSLDELDENAMGRFFPNVSFDDVMNSIRGGGNYSSYNNTIMYPKSGAQSIVNHLTSDINLENIKCNVNISSIDFENKIVYTDDETFQYDILFSTIPLPSFLKLSNYHVLDFERVFQANKVLVLNMGFDKKATQDYDWIYFPEKRYNFYRVGFYNNIMQSDKLSIYIEIGFNKNSIIDVNKEKENALTFLKDIGLIKDHKLIASNELLMDPAYVYISEESERMKKKIFKDFENNGIFFAGRYGMWTYCSMEDCFEQAKTTFNRSKKYKKEDND